MMRGIAGVAAGLVVWAVVATVGNLVLRAVLPGYAEAEAALRAAEPRLPAAQGVIAFTLAMQFGRLLIGAVSSVVAGVVTAWVGRASRWAAWILGIVLVALFIPVHVGLWDTFPIWYHLTFLVSLLPLALLGALAGARLAR